MFKSEIARRLGVSSTTLRNLLQKKVPGLNWEDIKTAKYITGEPLTLIKQHLLA